VDGAAVDGVAVDGAAVDGAGRAVTLGRRRAAGLAVLAVAVLALLVTVAVPAGRVLGAWRTGADRSAAVQAARQETLNLTTISFRTADRDIQRMLDGATGTFRTQFDQRAKPFLDTVREAKVESTGSISEAGVESAAGDTVTVLVAATAQVSNTAGPAGSPRDYRLRLVVRHEAGRWLVADVNFVP
jgi:Mce-associated membrane protein